MGDQHPSAAAKRLLEVLWKFRRLEFHKQGFEGYNHSLMRLMLILNIGQHQSGKGLTVSDISSKMNVTPPTITPLIKTLESDGLVLRIHDQEDRRVVRVELTEQGRQFVKRLQDSRIQQMSGLSSYMGEERTEQFVVLLEEVLQYFEENDNREV